MIQMWKNNGYFGLVNNCLKLCAPLLKKKTSKFDLDASELILRTIRNL